MQVHEGMTPTILAVGPGHTLRDAARLMSERQVGAAVVIDPDGPGVGILTERDILTSVGGGQDPDRELSRSISRATSSMPLRTGRSRRPPRRWSAAASVI